MSLFTSLVPVAMLGLALGVVQPTTALGRAPRHAGPSIERSASGFAQRLRLSTGAPPAAEIAQFPLDDARGDATGPRLFDAPTGAVAAVFSPELSLSCRATVDPSVQLVLSRRSRSSDPGFGRPPPIL